MKHWWNNTPWRLIQTNLREIDMQDIQADEYVKQLQEFKATVVMINTGGILASYDTEVEDHPKSPFLTGSSLKEIMNACHDAGIRVIARMDFSKARKEVYERHPDWAYRSASGDIINYNGDVHMCPCGGVQQEKVFEIMEEVVRKFPIDGVFINMGGFRERDYSYREYGRCYCENCQKRFRAMYGLEIPAKEETDDSILWKYILFKEQVTKDINQRMAKMIKSINPEIAVDGLDFARVESNTEYKVRRDPYWIYSSSSVARGATSLSHDHVCSNAAVDFIGFFYRHVAVDVHMQALRMWQDLGNYVGLDYYLMGRLDNHKDRKLYAPVKKAFSFMAAHDEDYRGMFISGDVLLIRGDRYSSGAEARGWIRALTESHIFFEESSVLNIHSVEDIRRFKAVILPDKEIISEELIRIFDQYVQDGGCLIITGKTAHFSDGGVKRTNFGFECMGKATILAERKDMRSGMFRIRSHEADRFPKFTDTELIFFGDEYRCASYGEDTEQYLGLIPPHHYGPPERCYYTEETQDPGFTVHTYGAGKGIQIPWFPGKLYYEEGYENTFCFMKEILLSFAGIETAENTPFTPMVEITRGYREDGKQAMISFINGTGHFGRSFFQPVPVQNISVRTALKEEPKEMYSIVTGEKIPFTYQDGKISFILKNLGEFEALKIIF